MSKISATLRIVTAVITDSDLTASKAFNRLSKHFPNVPYNGFAPLFTEVQNEDSKRDEVQRARAFASMLDKENEVIGKYADLGFRLSKASELEAMQAELTALRATVAEYAGKVSPVTGRKASNG
jgi:hypothetical protein